VSFVVNVSIDSAAATDTVAAKARAAILETKPMLEIMHSATIGLVVAFGATAYESCVTKVGGVVTEGRTRSERSTHG
jgi:choline-glycine betaine transporter